jgi:alpha-D-ribose 1-methylphosphonate 5-triphosphate synthase subunit PhnL
MTAAVLEMAGVGKSFTLHHRGGAELAVLENVHLTVNAGECVALDGPSGMGKSTLLTLIYANYRTTTGAIRVNANARTTDVARASPRELLALRRDQIAYVSQFLRVIPRIAAIDIVAQPLMEDSMDDAAKQQDARDRAKQLLLRLRIPSRLWHLPPATFSGGEQQRINVARGMIKAKPLLLLDEPTASLDEENRQTVINMITEARDAGAAVIGIFHDARVRSSVATRTVHMSAFR